MADEPEDDDLQTDELTEDQTEDQQVDEATDQTEDGEEGYELSFGDEAAPASGESDTGLVRHLRQEVRKRDDELKALRQAATAKPSVEDPGPEPDYDRDGASFDWDQTAFIAHWKEWNAKREAFERSSAEREAQTRQASEEWNREYQSYQSKRAVTQTKFRDYDEVEGTAIASLSTVQQAVIVRVAGDPALVLYALGRHPDKLAELSKITDPLKLAHTLAGLEKGLKAMPKRNAPPPEQHVSGNASVVMGKDKEEERLEKEADRTGDRTALIAYRRSKRQAA